MKFARSSTSGVRPLTELGIMACKLCLQNKPLSDSHILPEFVYRPTYDRDHTAVLVDLQAMRRGTRQRGFTERLLCADCEQHIGRWESYFASVWLHPNRSVRPKQLIGDLVQIPGLDYWKFKLFHLSLVWRAGVSSRREFDTVRLGPHTEKLRKHLLNDDPGSPFDYSFFGVAQRDGSNNGFQDQILRAFEAARVNGHWVYSAIFGGVVWYYYVSSHSLGQLVPVDFDQTGVLTLGIENWTDNLSVRDMARRMPPRRK
jgi:hypothetical protein